jgi:hypothetical protein
MDLNGRAYDLFRQFVLLFHLGVLRVLCGYAFAVAVSVPRPVPPFSL